MAKKKSQKSPQKPQKRTTNGSAQSEEIPDSLVEENHTEPEVNGTSIPPIEKVTKEKEQVTTPEEFKERGNVEFKQKNYSGAIDHYSKAIDLNPNEPNYWNNRAAAYMAQNQFTRALPDVKQASLLQFSSPQPKTLLRLARCYFALGNVTGSLNTLRSLFLADSNNAAALLMQKNVKRLEDHLQTFKDARERKDWGVARLALDKCFQECEGPGDDEWKKWKVEMEIVKQRWDSAVSLATEALRASPQSPDLMYLRALVLFLTSSIPQAINHAQSALRFDQEHTPARKLLKRVREVERLKEEGNNAFKSGKLIEAISKYTECLDSIGEKEGEGKGGQIRATLLSNRATALLKQGKAEEALDDTKSCLELSPESFKALRTQARCYLQLESYEEAVQTFKSALHSGSISPEDERSLKKELQKAEVLLKRSKTKDYYKILGLPKDCSESDIKKAYRKESLKHHPDKGGDEEKFKLVVEAHAVLSDPRRRERYDMGIDEDGSMDSSGMGGMGGGMGGMNMADILAAMAAQGGGFSFSSGGGGGGFSSFGGGGHHRHHSHGGGFPF